MNKNNNDSSHFGSHFSEKSANQDFAERLKKRRNNFGLTQKKLAELINIDEGTIQNYEKGKFPKGDYLILLAKELKCSAGWLLTGEGPGPDPQKETPIYKVEGQDGLKVADKDQIYELHGGWKPRHVGEDYIYAGKVLEILAQKNAYSRALMANIDAFHAAIKSEVELQDTKNHLKSQGDLIKKLEQRILALERKDSASGGEL